jgi:hypothetical protein
MYQNSCTKQYNEIKFFNYLLLLKMFVFNAIPVRMQRTVHIIGILQ